MPNQRRKINRAVRKVLVSQQWTDSTTSIIPYTVPSVSTVGMSIIPYTVPSVSTSTVGMSGYLQVQPTGYPRLRSTTTTGHLLVQDLQGNVRAIAVECIESVAEHGEDKTVIRTISGDFHTVKHSFESILELLG